LIHEYAMTLGEAVNVINDPKTGQEIVVWSAWDGFIQTYGYREFNPSVSFKNFRIRGKQDLVGIVLPCSQFLSVLVLIP